MKTRPAWVAFGGILLAGAFTIWGLRPPDPVGAEEGDRRRFSAERAERELLRLMPEPGPRVVGSPPNQQVRDRLVGRLQALGFEVQLQPGRWCGVFGNCADVTNVWARWLPEDVEEAGPHVGLLSHFDSVAAGPGVADSLINAPSGLEIARALLSDSSWSSPLTLLFTDGEEVGLYGARVAMDHPWLESLSAVVNLEARGCCGPSLVFEMAGPTEAYVQALGTVPKPVSSSLFRWVYERMPNDTDLTVFRENGRYGVNLAFIRGLSSYHTPDDDLAHLSRATVQHQGETALAMVRGLTERPPQAGDGEWVWTDVAGAFLVRWPLPWTLPLALVAVFWMGARVARSWTQSGYGVQFLRAITFLGILFFGSTLLCIGGMLLLWSRGGGLLPLHPTPHWAWAAALATTAALFLQALHWVKLDPDSDAAEGAGHGLIALMALGTAVAAPGLSYLFLPTALLAGLIGGFTVAYRPNHPVRFLSNLIIALPMVVFWTESFVLLTDVLEVGATGAFGMWALMTVAPLLGPLAFFRRLRFGRTASIAFGVAGLAAFGVAYAQPSSSPEYRRPQNLVYHQRGPVAEWYADTTLAALGELEEHAPFGPPGPTPLLYMGYGSGARAAAEALQLLPPTVTSTVGPDRQVRVRAEPRRGGRWLLFVLPDSVRSAAMNGTRAPIHRLERGPWKGRGLLGNFADSDGSVELELELFPNDRPQELWVYEVSFGLPPEGQRLVQARNQAHTTIQAGDLTMVGQAVPLGALEAKE